MELLPLAILALPFAAYGLILWRRRVLCRQAAERMHARCIQHGSFETGAIVGEDFAVEPLKVGKTIRTTVRVSADGCPNDFVLRPGFFQASPQWSEARVHVVTRQRAFLWEVALPGLGEPTEAHRWALLSWINPRALDASFGDRLKQAKVREVLVSDGFVGTRLPGVVLEPERLEPLIALLRQIGASAESFAPAVRVAALARPA